MFDSETDTPPQPQAQPQQQQQQQTTINSQLLNATTSQLCRRSARLSWGLKNNDDSKKNTIDNADIKALTTIQSAFKLLKLTKQQSLVSKKKIVIHEFTFPSS